LNQEIIMPEDGGNGIPGENYPGESQGKYQQQEEAAWKKFVRMLYQLNPRFKIQDADAYQLPLLIKAGKLSGFFHKENKM